MRKTNTPKIQKQKKSTSTSADNSKKPALLTKNYLTDVIESSSEFIGTADENGNVIYLNKSGRKLLGINSLAQFRKKTISDFIHDNDINRVFNSIIPKLLKKKKLKEEVSLKSIDGSEILLELSAFVHESEKGKKLLSVVGRDISNRKAQERLIHNYFEQYNTILTTTPDGFWLTDINGRLLEVNNNYCKMSGYKRNELLKLSVTELVAMESPEETARHIQQTITKGSDVFQSKHRAKNGKIFDVEVTTTFLESKRQFITFIRDITEIKKALQTIKENEEKFRLLIEKSPVGIFLDDSKGNAIFINDKCAELIGVLPENAINMNWISAIHPDDRERVMSKLTNTVQNITEFHLEYRWVHEDGKIVWTRGDIIPVKDENNQVVVYIGTLTDITSRKRAEDEVKRLNRVYAVLIDTNQTIIRTRDKQKLFEEICRIAVEKGKFHLAWIGIVNKENNEIEVVASAQLKEVNIIEEKITISGIEQCRCLSKKVIESNNYFVVNNIEQDNLLGKCKKDSVTLGCKSAASFLIRMENEIIGTFNLFSKEIEFFHINEVKLLDEMALDISFGLEFIDMEEKRKKLLEELKASGEQFRKLFELSPIGIGIADLTGNLLAYNDAILAQANYKREDAAKIKHVAELYYDPKQRAEVLALFQKQGYVRNHHVLFKRKDGTPYDALMSLTSTTFEGKPALYALIEDITERIKSERALKISEKKYRDIFENAAVSI
ncbi:MAG: PAS domain S-box protein [Ignavibacteria bacterium]|nr:PAS domain S-box protein [Ignavibacteria bacterium]